MILIAHRGNLFGPNSELENNPTYIDDAIHFGADVEIDLRVFSAGLYLGHDIPQYYIDLEWIKQRSDKLWIHCKNKEALTFCLANNFHCFWHNIDDYTITSHGYVWAYPGKENVGDKCVLVMPELHWDKSEIMSKVNFGICTDFVKEYEG
jgi:hypothetical protein